MSRSEIVDLHEFLKSRSSRSERASGPTPEISLPASGSHKAGSGASAGLILEPELIFFHADPVIAVQLYRAADAAKCSVSDIINDYLKDFLPPRDAA